MGHAASWNLAADGASFRSNSTRRPFAKASGQVSALCTGMNPAGRSAIFAPHKLLPTRLASPVWAALGDLGAQGVLVGRSLEGLAGGMQLQHQFTSLRTAGTSKTT